MAIIEERSPAKVNLSLKILGKRPDGYHELRSLVAFGREAADIVSLDTDAPAALTVSGPFATRLEGENILTRTLALVREEVPNATLGSVLLDKRLPVAAGIGGGSANAAALLRALRRANPGLGDTRDWHGLAVRLGADVAVCLESRASVMTGIGDRVHPVETPWPDLYAVMANPLVPVPHDKTARVFRALAAPPLEKAPSEPFWARAGISTRETIVALMREDGNDLTRPALSVIPETAHVLEALRDLDGSVAAALSGAGPTAFALFYDREAAHMAARRLHAAHPNWWVEPTALM